MGKYQFYFGQTENMKYCLKYFPDPNTCVDRLHNTYIAAHYMCHLLTNAMSHNISVQYVCYKDDFVDHLWTSLQFHIQQPQMPNEHIPLFV